MGEGHLAAAVAREAAGTATGVCLTFMALGWIVFTPVFGGIADASGSFAAMWGALAGVLALAGVAAPRIRPAPS